MTASNIRTKWAKATPLDRAWVECADLGDALNSALQCIPHLLRGGFEGSYFDAFDQEFKKRHPKNWIERERRRQEMQEVSQELLKWILASGWLRAFGVRISPTLDDGPVELPAGLFAATDGKDQAIRWQNNVIEVGQVIVADIRIASDPRQEARPRGRPSMSADLRQAMVFAELDDSDFFKQAPKQAYDRTIEVLGSRPEFKDSDAVRAHIKTFRPLFAEMKRERTTQ